jgi:hypothetical protein
MVDATGRYLSALDDDRAIGGMTGLRIKRHAEEAYRTWMLWQVSAWSEYREAEIEWRRDTVLSLSTLDAVFVGDESEYLDDMIAYAESEGATEADIRLTLRMLDTIKPLHSQPNHVCADWCPKYRPHIETDAWGRRVMQAYDGHSAWGCNNLECAEHPANLYGAGKGNAIHNHDNLPIRDGLPYCPICGDCGHSQRLDCEECSDRRTDGTGKGNAE